MITAYYCFLENIVNRKLYKPQSHSTVATDLKIWLGLLFYSILCLMLVSPNSYLHDMTHHHDFGYYITIASTSAIWAVLWLQKAFSSFPLTNRRLAALSLGCIAVVSLILIPQDNLVWQQSLRREQFNAINALMSTKEYPRILHSAHETGLDITAEALPAFKYWAMQSGGTNIMVKQQLEAIKNGVPDFVTIQFDGFRDNVYKALYQSGLYRPCILYDNHNGCTIEV